ncbi:hypothetical protein MAM1_0010c01108 [Mucor ambiguus]|uniref:Uncharacterized protein n=1 Tax=Mucor ambiguus TaxID=91626 RepID=A0A0C9M5E1_9FUNG|nr:hypothetical protein MAM1_0010c01108 [Mucor ambiguus]
MLPKGSSKNGVARLSKKDMLQDCVIWRLREREQQQNKEQEPAVVAFVTATASVSKSTATTVSPALIDGELPLPTAFVTPQVAI